VTSALDCCDTKLITTAQKIIVTGPGRKAGMQLMVVNGTARRLADWNTRPPKKHFSIFRHKFNFKQQTKNIRTQRESYFFVEKKMKKYT
jgi:hypothetical protein